MSRPKPVIRAIDLCAGAGGWACAAAGLPVRVIAAVDLWGPACQTYELNHPRVHVIRGDVRLEETVARLLTFLRADAVGTKGAGEFGVDLVLGAIPCEWLSVCRTGGNAPQAAELAAERATLRSVLEIVRLLTPRWWCLEDVKGLVPELPAGTPWIEIDSSAYSCQRRKRIYVGKFPRPQGTGPLIGDASGAVLGGSLRPGPYRIGARSFGRTPVTSGAFARDKAYVADPRGKSPTICNISSRRDVECLVLDPAVPGGMRQMEWQEAAAIQGFPEHYLFYGSPTDVGRQIGRAIQIDTGRVILSGIVAQWLMAEAGPPMSWRDSGSSPDGPSAVDVTAGLRSRRPQ